MITFTLLPYTGTDPITFDMTASDVENILGPSEKVRINSFGERDEMRHRMFVRYDRNDQKVVELAFVPGATVLFQNESLFERADLHLFLSHFDPNPQLLMGFLIFLKLGITLTGFHDDDLSQRAITIFRRGRWDKYLKDASPILFTPMEVNHGARTALSE